MLKTFAGALAVAGAILVVQPSAQAAPRIDGASTAVTQDLSAATVTTRTTVRRGNNTRTVVRTRTYAAPSYYGYYGPTVYTRPYARPAPVFLGVGGYW